MFIVETGTKRYVFALQEAAQVVANAKHAKVSKATYVDDVQGLADALS